VPHAAERERDPHARREGTHVERIVAEAADRARPQRLILTRSLYYCTYPPIAPLHLARAFTVL